ncbi:IclR family transcriptional regulator [Marihabitans asiaticum]|uniref:Glycerol operon regulatory protein n=1 Tax=Marihabitans asiaticum TaxID=415218 RepID=A0A560WFY4_9MICO|nr:IclR family transcriptional regulator [Marihabitans asiaticum]TWD16602.1 IclR family transcriptional regulator [Marihabitans asiaticum]
MSADPVLPRVTMAEDPWCTTTPKRVAPESGGLRSVTTALDVLECFASDGDLGVSDIARRLGVAKSTAHRVLSTLAGRGFIEQDRDTGLYRLGLHLFELGMLVQARHPLRHAALPTLRQVAAQTGHTVNLGVADGPDVVFVERIEMGEGGRVLGHAGRRFPAHVTATGKALAAFDGELDRARRAAGFPPRARCTVRTEAQWDDTLQGVRLGGYAMAVDESFDGITSIAVPVLRGQHAIACVSVFGPTDAVHPQVDRIVPLLRAASRRISLATPFGR